MASVSKAKLTSDIQGILKGADLSSLSSKKVRKQLEAKYDTDLTERKGEVDAILMDLINAQDSSQEEEKDAESDHQGSSQSESDLEEPEDVTPKKKIKKASQDSDAAIAKRLQEEENSTLRQTRRGSRTPSKAPAKRKAPAAGNRTKKPNKYTEALMLSTQLSAILGVDRLKRSDVVKEMWRIIKERNLQDPSNKQYILCDTEFLAVFGQKRVKPFGMMKYLNEHMFRPDEKGETVDQTNGNSANELSAGEESGDGDEDNNKPAKRKTKPKTGNKTKKTNKYTESLVLSPQLSAILGVDRLKRSDVVKEMWRIIKERNLQDPSNKQYILCDTEFLAVFGRRRLKPFGMMKYLNEHMFRPDEKGEIVDQANGDSAHNNSGDAIGDSGDDDSQ